jgi:hypothetical protein
MTNRKANEENDEFLNCGFVSPILGYFYKFCLRVWNDGGIESSSVAEFDRKRSESVKEDFVLCDFRFSHGLDHSYREDFKLQYEHFKSELAIFKLNPSEASKRFNNLVKKDHIFFFFFFFFFFLPLSFVQCFCSDWFVGELYCECWSSLCRGSKAFCC